MKYRIVVICKYYQPINLKQVSEILEKSESTIYHHFKQMKNDNIIVLDVDATESKRGKYYKLANDVQNYFDNQLDQALNEFDETVEEIQHMDETQLKKRVYQKLIDSIEARKNIENTLKLQNHLAQVNLSNVMKKLDTTKKMIDDPKDLELKEYVGGLNAIMGTFELVTFDHSLEFAKIIANFIRDIKQLEEKIKSEIEEKDIPNSKLTTQYYSLFTSPMEIESDK